MKAETLHWVILIALVAGLGLSIFAWQETVNPGLQTVCSVNPLFSCQAVDRSGHNTVLGYSDYLVGIVGFSLMLAFDIPLMLTWRRWLLNALLLLSIGGVAFSIYFAYVETFIIGAVCPVCLSTYIANGIVLACAIVLWRRGRPGPKKTLKRTGESSAAA